MNEPTVVDTATLEPGLQALPGYRLRRLLGSGGFAQVWEAETDDGQRVALKFLPCSEGRHPSEEIRALQAIRTLKHPNLVRIDQVWCHDGHIVIAMEKADGSLSDLMESYRVQTGRPIGREHLILLMSEAATALDFLNKRQHRLNGQCVAIQHCDVKPGNMLLFGDAVKLTDFGLSSWMSGNMKTHRRAGTLDYTAPEVFQGRLSQWTDQYSLAVTYCHLRLGILPFSDTPTSFRPDYVRPKPNLTGLAAREGPILARALASIPQDRWPTCSELVDRLAEAVLTGP